NSGTTAATTASGALAVSTPSSSSTSGAHTTTGTLNQRGRRGFRAAGPGSAVYCVQVLPSHQRHPPTVSGSGYQAAGGAADRACGAGSGAAGGGGGMRSDR